MMFESDTMKIFESYGKSKSREAGMMAESKVLGEFLRFSIFHRLFRLLYLTLISSFFQFQASFQRRKILFCLSVLGPIHSIALYSRNIFETFHLISSREYLLFSPSWTRRASLLLSVSSSYFRGVSSIFARHRELHCLDTVIQPTIFPSEKKIFSRKNFSFSRASLSFFRI